MKKVHLVICDLFLPVDVATVVCRDLHLPALEKMLARGADRDSGDLPIEQIAIDGLSLEAKLCDMFGVPCQPQAPVAPISAAFDGLGAGCWLRADPVHLSLVRDQLVLLPAVNVSSAEAGQLCAALNEYFHGQGMKFFAPHPQRWYACVDRLPKIETVPLSQAAGRNLRDLLPRGIESARWHKVFNEAQMLLFAHPVNEAREARGELPVNSLWFWGGGSTAMPGRTFDNASSDDVLTEMFARVAGIPFSGWSEHWQYDERGGSQLLVWTALRSALQRGDLEAWRLALQNFETGYAKPLWQALRSGKISQVLVDIQGGDVASRLLLTRSDVWKWWRRARPLADIQPRFFC